MPKSPFCPQCITHFGLLSNTYKLAGKPAFRCGICKNIIPSDQFDPEDFMWESDPDKWKQNMKSKQVDVGKLKGVK